MAVIDSVTYKEISDLINNAQVRGNDIYSNIEQMDTDLEDSEILSTNIHRQFLENVIAETLGVINLRHIVYTDQMRDFVRRLQIHVDINYSGTINEYLSNNSIQVLPIFADISDVVGFSIDAANIESIS